MNRSLTTLVVATAGLLIAAGCASNQSNRATASCCCGACVGPAGSKTAVDVKTADALRESLQDERRAEAFYTAVTAKYGQVRPFSNIVHAEGRHAAVIEMMMTRHDVPVPANAQTDPPAVPGTLAECNRLAAQLEVENIAMYDRLLGDVTAPDIRAAFENLRNASKSNHLPAFERWSATAGSASTGRPMAYAGGRGSGNGRLAACRGPCAMTP